MSGGYRKKEDEFRNCRLSAAAQSLAVLKPGLQMEFDFQPISERALRAVAEQWTPVPRNEWSDHWDWEEIARAYRGGSDWSLALWSGDHLAALAAANLRGKALCWDYLEGHPEAGSALKPQRFAIILDAYMRYGRMCKMTEIRIEPLNDPLANRYQTVYKFKPHPTEAKCLRLEL